MSSIKSLLQSDGVWNRPTPRRKGGSSWRFVKIEVLFVCHDPFEAMFLLALVDGAPGLAGISLHLEDSVPKALETCREKRFDVILLLDASGYALQQAEELRHERPDIPQVVVVQSADDETAMRAIKAGVQDFLLKEELSGSLLLRALRYAVERHRLQLELRSLSLTDELTNLHNRRGCSALANQLYKQAMRLGKKIAVFYVDVDGLKQINDRYGHATGDRIIAATGEVLRESFRESDVVCRFGGDEFVVAAIDDEDEFANSIRQRLEERQSYWNRSNPNGPLLSFSVGEAFCDPQTGEPLERCLDAADAELYRRKMERRGQSDSNPNLTSVIDLVPKGESV